MNRGNNEFYSEETELILQKKLEIAIKREKAQALALSNQVFIHLCYFLLLLFWTLTVFKIHIVNFLLGDNWENSLLKNN